MTADILTDEKLTELNTTIREGLEAVGVHQRRAADHCKRREELADCYGEVDEISAATATVQAALDRIGKHLQAYRLAHAPEQCAKMAAIDDQCRRPARPHMSFCDHHVDQELDYQVSHPAVDCCPQCCEGTAEHTSDGLAVIGT